MGTEPDEDRIRRKAHDLWEAEGHPHGRDQAHWDQAKEMVAIEDSLGDTLLPADTGAAEPIENANEALRNLGDFPNLTDQGENLLTSTDREPELTAAGGGGMPSIEVPTSGQPGISTPVPAKAPVQSSSKPAQPVSATPTGAKAPTAAAPKVAAPEPAKSGAASKKSGQKKK